MAGGVGDDGQGPSNKTTTPTEHPIPSRQPPHPRSPRARQLSAARGSLLAEGSIKGLPEKPQRAPPPCTHRPPCPREGKIKLKELCN